MILFYFFFFVFGTIIGSFLNVVILRFHTGKNLSGRSGCFSCGKKLLWFELIPVISFLFLRGKCHGCKTRVSRQYPLVEAGTGLLFVLFAYLDNVFLFPHLPNLIVLFFDLTIWSTLMVIGVYDLRHMIIPDEFVITFSAAAFIRVLFLFWSRLAPAGFFYDHILAAIALSLFFFALWAVSRGRWIGFGDGKFAFGIGLYTGLAEGLSALAFAFWIGAAVALLHMSFQYLMGISGLRGKGKIVTMKTEIPFAPFLILGTLIAITLQSDIFHLSLFFS